MSLNTSSYNNNKNNVERNMLWQQQRDKLITNSEVKPTFNNIRIDLTRDNDLNEKGDGEEISDELSSSEEISQSECLSVRQFNCDREEENKRYVKDVCDNTTQYGFINKPQEAVKDFDKIKAFLMTQLKPEPFVINVLKTFIKTQELGKYISRGIQAEINFNFCTSPKTDLSEPVCKNDLEEVYAPLKDVCAIDVTNNYKRPMTTPMCNRVKINNTCNMKKWQLRSAVVNVFSIENENKKKAINNINYLKPSHIPKLILNNTGKQHHDTKKSCTLPTSLFCPWKSPQIQPKQKNEWFTLSNKKSNESREQQSNNTKLLKTFNITTQSKTFESKQKVSKIPIAKTHELLNIQRFNSVITPTLTVSKTFSFEDPDSSIQLSTCGSSRTIIPAIVDQKHSEKTSIESIQTENSKPNQFLLNTNLQSELPQKLCKENSNLWISVKEPENKSAMITENCSKTFLKKHSSYIHKIFEKEVPKLPKRLESDIRLDESNRNSYETAIFRRKKEIEKQNHTSKEFGIKPNFSSILKSENANKKMFLENTIKYITNPCNYNDKKSHKNDKQKQTFKTEGCGNERFILSNKVTYVLKNNPSSKKINTLSLKRSGNKHKMENIGEVKQFYNRPEQSRNFPIERTKKYCSAPSKFATYPRQYEELKLNRNKERAYVLVKNSSNTHMRFSSKYNEPFKIISLEPSPLRSCENPSYSLLTKSQLWNSYSYVLVSPKDSIQTQRCFDKSSDVTYTLSDSSLFTASQKGKYFKQIDSLPSLSAVKTVKSISPRCEATNYPSDTEPESKDLIDNGMSYLLPSKFDVHVKPKKSEKLPKHVNFNSNYLVDNKCIQSKIKTKCLSNNKKWQQENTIRLKEWVKNIEKTENTLSKLRKKISCLSTILKQASQKRVSLNIEQQFYKPLTFTDNTSITQNVCREQCACRITENNEHKQQTYKLPERQTAVLCMCSTVSATTGEDQKTLQCDCRKIQRDSNRCSCLQAQIRARLPNSSLSVKNKPSHSDKFPCIPSVPLHLLVPHAVI